MPLPPVATEASAGKFGCRSFTVSALVLLVALLAGCGGAAAWPEACDANGYCGEFIVGGPLHAATWLDDDRMYLADGEGNIRLLNVVNGQVRTVRSDRAVYKGITLLDDWLYLSDVEPMCAALRAARASSESLQEATRHFSNLRCPRIFLRNSLIPDLLEALGQGTGGQVLAYRVDSVGNLSDRKVVIDRVAAFDLHHSLNGLANDGEYVYASIGHPANQMTPDAEVLRDLVAQDSSGARTDWWGTVIRFRPPDREGEIYASGLRNTYGIAVAPDGIIYGGDNDDNFTNLPEGMTPPAKTHREELNALVPGGFYGYPRYGTNDAPAAAGVIEPAAIIPGMSSTAVYANRDGVYLSYLLPGAGAVIDRFDYGTFTPERVFQGGGLITALLEREGLLYAVSINGKVLAIDPRQRTETLRQRLRQPGQLMARSNYAIYFDAAARALNYVQEAGCQPDTAAKFFLHLTPVNPADLPLESRELGFENRDFFSYERNFAGPVDEQCLVSVPLPDYPIDHIHTGQFIPGQGPLWAVEFSLGE